MKLFWFEKLEVVESKISNLVNRCKQGGATSWGSRCGRTGSFICVGGNNSLWYIPTENKTSNHDVK